MHDDRRQSFESSQTAGSMATSTVSPAKWASDAASISPVEPLSAGFSSEADADVTRSPRSFRRPRRISNRIQQLISEIESQLHGNPGGIRRSITLPSFSPLHHLVRSGASDLSSDAEPAESDSARLDAADAFQRARAISAGPMLFKPITSSYSDDASMSGASSLAATPSIVSGRSSLAPTPSFGESNRTATTADSGYVNYPPAKDLVPQDRPAFVPKLPINMVAAPVVPPHPAAAPAALESMQVTPLESPADTIDTASTATPAPAQEPVPFAQAANHFEQRALESREQMSSLLETVKTDMATHETAQQRLNRKLSGINSQLSDVEEHRAAIEALEASKRSVEQTLTKRLAALDESCSALRHRVSELEETNHEQSLQMSELDHRYLVQLEAMEKVQEENAVLRRRVRELEAGAQVANAATSPLKDAGAHTANAATSPLKDVGAPAPPVLDATAAFDNIDEAAMASMAAMEAFFYQSPTKHYLSDDESVQQEQEPEPRYCPSKLDAADVDEEEAKTEVKTEEIQQEIEKPEEPATAGRDHELEAVVMQKPLQTQSVIVLPSQQHRQQARPVPFQQQQPQQMARWARVPSPLLHGQPPRHLYQSRSVGPGSVPMPIVNAGARPARRSSQVPSKHQSPVSGRRTYTAAPAYRPRFL